jgi:16S rRNA (uracil1498-N3)-methyltransferase
VLAGAEGRHATTVRRLGPGERADLTDGSGTVAECVVTAARPGELELSVLARRVWPFERPEIQLLLLAASGLLVDILMKSLLAPSYGLFLRQLARSAGFVP